MGINFPTTRVVDSDVNTFEEVLMSHKRGLIKGGKIFLRKYERKKKEKKETKEKKKKS